uniref:Uncharacterized protein n=1 Tax=Anguilla anguilla TaxID=7936 RepID=A0A0E9QL57_ANGAN
MPLGWKAGFSST